MSAEVMLAIAVLLFVFGLSLALVAAGTLWFSRRRDDEFLTERAANARLAPHTGLVSVATKELPDEWAFRRIAEAFPSNRVSDSEWSELLGGSRN